MTIEFRDDVLKLYTLYLEKVDSLNDKERAAYVRYMDCIGSPPIVSGPRILPKELKSFK